MAGAEAPVVQLAIPEGQWTREGRPYVQPRAAHPGVIVSFSKPRARRSITTMGMG